MSQNQTELGRSITDDGRDCGKWTKEEDMLLKKAVDTIGARNWKRISQEFLGGKRSDVQCLHRWQKVLKPGLIKGPWTKEEDETIMEAIKSGVTKWSEIATLIPGRIGKQCRERWFNHLDPSIKKGGWTEEEDRILVEYQEKLGNRWCEIAKVLPGRSENAVKNRWNSAMRRKFQQKRKSQGPLAAAVASPSPLDAAKPSANKPARSNVRLPPEVILVEQPSNKNSVIAAREKIRKHQEQLEKQKSPGSVSLSSGSSTTSHGTSSLPVLGSGNTPTTSTSTNSLLAKLQEQQQKKQLEKQRQRQQDKLQKSIGENINSLSNTRGNTAKDNQMGAQKRTLGETMIKSEGKLEASDKDNKPVKKRAKKQGFRMSKAVNNLRDYMVFERELGKKKPFAGKQFSDFEKQNLHQKTLAIINEAEHGQTNLSITMVWSRLSEFVKKGGLEDHSNSMLEPLPINFKSSGGPKGKPRDLRVQCSLDPSTWTLSGGTPTIHGNSTTTPLGDMLSSLIPPFSGINPSIFSPTPRHGMSLHTPLHAFPTPTAAEIKKIDQLDDPLFPDSMFFNMDSSGLAGLSTSFGGSVLSPIFRQHPLASSQDQQSQL